jgi:hypothetical protein
MLLVIVGLDEIGINTPRGHEHALHGLGPLAMVAGAA